MAFYLSPLVDVNEIDLSTTIPAVATSIAVTVLRDTWKGDELKRTLITTRDELIENFGEPLTRANCYQDILSATGYLKYGNALYCTRAMAPSATFAGADGTLAATAVFNSFTTDNTYTLSSFSSEDPDEYPDEVSFGTGGVVDPNSTISFISESRGAWGNYTKIAIVGRDVMSSALSGSSSTDYSLSAELDADINAIDVNLSDDAEFVIIVKAASQKALTTFTIKETHVVSTKVRGLDDEGKNIFIENVINQESNYIRVALRSTVYEEDVNTGYTADYVTLGGGQDSDDSYVADVTSDADIITAFNLYADPDLIDVNLFIDSNKSVTVKEELITICEARKDSMAILDCIKSDVVNTTGETTNIRDWKLGTFNPNTSYAALYGNWLEIYDRWNAKYRWIPASGHVSGVYANTDDVNDPWFAPAGFNRAILTNIRRLAFNPTKGNRDILYQNGINPIVSFAGQGKVVWGQKTVLGKSSAFNRVNVRRLFMTLEKALSTALKYFLFEPNDEFTRLQLVDMITPFLRDIEARRGLYDFMVVCDARNNTAERIDRNELWVDVYVKPTRAAEYVVLNMIATKTGASFTELVAATEVTA